MRMNQVPIDSPCHESWDAMAGDAERRFCGVCQKHVHNLSEMRHDEAQSLLRASGGEHLCVRYTAEEDGTLRFRDLVPRGLLTRKLLRTAFAATMLAACTPHDDKPRDLGDVIIDGVGGHAVATPDGGCNYTTGPFTTFHLPPGHALCQNAGPPEAPVIVTPVIEDLIEEPQMPLMGAIAPAIEPPPQVVDPVPVPQMGEAIAAPEAVDPFVPCDPHPGYAPPPPSQPEPSHVKMGDVAETRPPPKHKLQGKPIRPREDF